VGIHPDDAQRVAGAGHHDGNREFPVALSSLVRTKKLWCGTCRGPVRRGSTNQGFET
jgi:hypothetical protein